MPVFNKYLGIVTAGDTFCIALDDDLIPSVKNNGPQIATNIIVTITVPTGIEFLTGGSTISKGFFDEVLGKWNIGSLIKNESATASFCFEVTDACVLPYEIIFNVDSDACECQLNNNQLTATLDGISCCDVLECVTEDYIVYDSRPYKSYVALVGQEDTDDPTATVYENTTGYTVTWTRDQIGQYIGTFVGAPVDIDLLLMTPTFVDADYDTGFIIQQQELYIITNTVRIDNYLFELDGGPPTPPAPSLDGFKEIPIEIRLYP